MRQAFAGHDLEPAILSLRRRALARRRPRSAAAAGRPPERTQQGLEASEQSRHPRHARQVGVPVVRRMGPRVSLHRFGARRSGGGEASAPPFFPRMVHAPEREAARVRMGLQRRQSADPRLGGARRCSKSTAAPTSIFWRGPSTSSSSISPGGSIERTPRATTYSRADSLGSTTSGLSIDRPCCPAAKSSSNPTRRPGWRNTASTCWRSRSCSPITIRPTRTSRSNSSSTSGRSPRRWTNFGTMRTAFSMTACASPMAELIVVRARSMVGLLPVFASVRLKRLAMGGAAEFPRARPMVHGQRASGQRLHDVTLRRASSPSSSVSSTSRGFRRLVRANARRAGVPVALRAAFALALPS